MAFKQALGERNSWLPLSRSPAATFKPDILKSCKEQRVW